MAVGEEDEIRELQWNVGDCCQATFRGDGRLYQAIIKKIRKKKSGLVVAQVEFIGYEEDGLETVLISDLVPLPKHCRRAVFLGSSQDTMIKTGINSNITNSFYTRRSEGLLLPQEVKEKYELLEKESVLNEIRHGHDFIDDKVKKPVKGKKRRQTAAGDREEESNQAKIASKGCDNVKPEMSHCQLDTDFTIDGFDDVLDKPCFDMAPVRPRLSFRLSSSGDPVVEIPAPLNQYLRDYQQLGAQFIYDHYMMNQGVILGDDMGLGKTIQIIAFLAAMLKKSNTKEDIGLWKRKRLEQDPSSSCDHHLFLIVCPASVLYNWRDELDTWGHFRYAIFHQSQKDDALDQARKRSIEVMLTTYDTVKRNRDLLESVRWSAAIFDEVHRLKDRNTQVTICMKSINVGVRIGLTGTAVQNNLMELWCLLDWANPDCLGCAADFEKHWAKPIQEGQRFDSTKRELAVTRTKQDQLNKIIGKWFVRRTKSIIADQLPCKDEKIVFCPLTPLQVSVYETMLKNVEFQLVIRAMEPCDCGSSKRRGQCCYKSNSEGIKWRYLILPFLTLLTKVCNHVGLLLPQSKASVKQQHKAEEICQEVFAKHHEFVHMTRQASFQTLSDPTYCGKMQVLDKLLQVFKAEGSKVVVFSQSTQVLAFITDFAVSCGYEYCRMDGSTSVKQRPAIVRSFNKDKNKFLFLISKGTGGVGLNLTGANVVIIYDPCWNPQTDMQAQDRCYRLGQSRDVRVYRFICQGTVEENIYLREVYKQQLSVMTLDGELAQRHFNCVAGDKDRKGELFGYENMFKLRVGDSCLTVDILKRTAELFQGVQTTRDELAYSRQRCNEEVRQMESIEDPHNDDDLYSLTSVASQLASEVGDETSPETERNQQQGSATNSSNEGDENRFGKNTAVDSALVSCGVKYTHANDLVVRSTRLEQKISAQAIEDVMEHHQNSQVAANVFCMKSNKKHDSNDKKRVNPGKRKRVSCAADRSNVRISASPDNQNDVPGVVVGRTPTAVRHEHFSRLVGIMQVDSPLRAAEIIISSSSEERKALLQKLYADTPLGQLNKQVTGTGSSDINCTVSHDKQIQSSLSAKGNELPNREDVGIVGGISVSSEREAGISQSVISKSFSIASEDVDIKTAHNRTEIGGDVASTGLSLNPVAIVDIDEFLFG